MNVLIREYTETDIPEMLAIWNEIVAEGNAFPYEQELDCQEIKSLFAEQTFCGVAQDTDTDKIVGLYILHPNGLGRLSHISNASYGVAAALRGKHIGEKLVKHCISKAAAQGFRILQFNAVVATNIHARHLYERCGFKQIGTIPSGFRMKDGHYEDICPYYIELK